MSKSLARKYAELFDKKPDDYEYHTQLFGEMVREAQSVKHWIGWAEIDFNFVDDSTLHLEYECDRVSEIELVEEEDRRASIRKRLPSIDYVEVNPFIDYSLAHGLSLVELEEMDDAELEDWVKEWKERKEKER